VPFERSTAARAARAASADPSAPSRMLLEESFTFLVSLSMRSASFVRIERFRVRSTQYRRPPLLSLLVPSLRKGSRAALSRMDRLPGQNCPKGDWWWGALHRLFDASAALRRIDQHRSLRGAQDLGGDAPQRHRVASCAPRGPQSPT